MTCGFTKPPGPALRSHSSRPAMTPEIAARPLRKSDTAPGAKFANTALRRTFPISLAIAAAPRPRPQRLRQPKMTRRLDAAHIVHRRPGGTRRSPDRPAHRDTLRALDQRPVGSPVVPVNVGRPPLPFIEECIEL